MQVQARKLQEFIGRHATQRRGHHRVSVGDYAVAYPVYQNRVIDLSARPASFQVVEAFKNDTDIGKFHPTQFHPVPQGFRRLRCK
jgi:hypothetical protein